MSQKSVMAAPDGITISLYVQPGAAKSEWAGVFDESLKLRIKAKPVEGEANRAVCEFIAAQLGVSKSSVSIVRGQTGRQKVVHVKGNAKDLLDAINLVVEKTTP
jgi:uncharacterized protein